MKYIIKLPDIDSEEAEDSDYGITPEMYYELNNKIFDKKDFFVSYDPFDGSSMIIIGGWIIKESWRCEVMVDKNIILKNLINNL